MTFAIPIRTLDALGRDIERTFDVTRLRQAGDPVWNVIRPQLVGTHVWSFSERGRAMSAGERRTMPVYEQLAARRGRGGGLIASGECAWSHAERAYEGRHITLRAYHSLERRPVAIFDPVDGLGVGENGRLESRLFDWAYDMLGRDRCLRIVPDTARWRGAQFDGPMVGYARIKDELVMDPSIAEPVEGAAELLKALDDAKLPNPFSVHVLNRWVRTVRARAIAFGELLDEMKPELVLLTTYKSSDHLALIRACRARSIRVVEYQHGILGPEYRALRVIDPARAFLPHGFWLWGEGSADWLQGSVAPEERPEVFVGGAPMLKTEEAPPAPPKPQTETYSVLLIEQYTHGDVAETAAQVMKSAQMSGLDVRLRMRVHPRSRHLIGQYARDFRRAGLEVDVERASLDPLDEVLAAADLVVVESSTVAFDANRAGRRVLVYGDTSGYLFQDDIERGAFAWVPSLSELGTKLETALRAPFVRSRFFAATKASDEAGRRWLTGAD